MFQYLPQALRALRESRGLDPQELADRAGLRPPQLENYESGTSTPRLDTLERVLDALEVTAHEFFAVLQGVAPGEPLDQARTAFALPENLPREAVAYLSESLQAMGRFLQLFGLQLLPLPAPSTTPNQAAPSDDERAAAISRSA